MDCRHRQEHDLVIELPTDANRNDHPRPQQYLARRCLLVGDGQLREERARPRVRRRRNLGHRSDNGSSLERVRGDGQFLAQEDALYRCGVERGLADHRVGHAEIDVNR